ncbi:tetratricopeptide repeat protein [Vibrio bivalvicida]|uniref:Tetratricopeptide repeat protein n=1 Tax=Vibrio bivalvicida TaxID=1276888 RepID=A0ABV4MI70_9VIBR
MARDGDPNAQLQLCHMYFNGEQVESDYHKAVEWCTQSAMNGQVDAQENLAKMFLGGLIIKQDYQSSYIWSTIAAQKNQGADTILTTLKRELTESEINEAKQKYALCLDLKPNYSNCPIPILLD